MAELDASGLAHLYAERAAAQAAPQPRVAVAYWNGRIDEFVAQNAVSDAELEAARATVADRVASVRKAMPRVRLVCPDCGGVGRHHGDC